VVSSFLVALLCTSRLWLDWTGSLLLLLVGMLGRKGNTVSCDSRYAATQLKGHSAREFLIFVSSHGLPPGGVRIDDTAEYLTTIQNTQSFLPHYYNALFAGLLLLISLN
jgi:hypothetical protein